MPFDPRQHLIQLKGRDYLPVAARLLWLNDETQRYKIETSILKLEDTFAVVQSTVSILDDTGNPQRSATAIKREDKTHFADYLEKAETGSIGRALGMLGFGTQFAPEFDELEARLEPRVVDTPQRNTDTTPARASEPRAPEPREPVAAAQEAARPALASIGGLKPASSLGPPTNKRKPQPEPEPRPATRVVAREELDVDDGLEEYDHSSVPDADVFTDTQVNRLMAIAERLFKLRGDDLEARVLTAASKILGRDVADLHALHWRDGGEVMHALEEQAKKKGVWDGD